MRTRLIAAGLVGLSMAYLALFVPRGWIPHDEGMIGQSAERVLSGEVPHVDYEEPYTGGLSWMHAAVFRLAGTDLIYPRWLLFAGAVAAQVLVYLILSRYLQPIGAAIGAWLALGWSFPNYFAALPSWWLLVCALVCVWAFIRYAETGFLRYAATAGLAAGLAILIKQTGVYVLVALVMALLYGGEERTKRAWWPGQILCAAAAVAALGLAVIPEFVARHRAGADVVFARRRSREEGWLLRLAYRAFYRIMSALSDTKLPLDTGDFALLGQPVVAALRRLPEHERYLRGLRAWVGFTQVGIDVDRHARAAGKPKYTTWKLMKLAVDGVCSFSIVPLRAAAVTGLVAIAASILFSVYAVYVRIAVGQVPAGFTASLVIMTFLSGVQLLFLGVIGEYLGRVYGEAKGRPPYVVARVMGRD